jgi:hypothetical protein
MHVNFFFFLLKGLTITIHFNFLEKISPLSKAKYFYFTFKIKIINLLCKKKSLPIHFESIL